MNHEEIPFEDDDEIIVYRCVRPLGMQYFTTRAPMPFDEFVALFGVPNRQAARQASHVSRPRPSKDAIEALRAQFPFLTDEDVGAAVSSTAAAKPCSGASGSASKAGEKSSVGDEAAAGSASVDVSDEAVD